MCHRRSSSSSQSPTSCFLSLSLSVSYLFILTSNKICSIVEWLTWLWCNVRSCTSQPSTAPMEPRINPFDFRLNSVAATDVDQIIIVDRLWHNVCRTQHCLLFLLHSCWKHSLLIRKYRQNCQPDNWSWNPSQLLLLLKLLFLAPDFFKFHISFCHLSYKSSNNSSLFDIVPLPLMVVLTMEVAMTMIVLVSILLVMTTVVFLMF